MSIYIDLLTGTVISYIKKEGKKLRDKDTNTTGGDDAGGRSLEAIAAGLETIDFSHIKEAKSLHNIGVALEVAGRKLQAEAANADQ